MVRVYHLSWSRFVPLIVLWIVVVAFLLSLSSLADAATERDDTSALQLTALTVTIVLLPFFGMLWQSRLVLTPEGIAHHQFGYTVRSTWSNVQALCLTPGVESLILTKPGTSSVLLRWSTRILQIIAPDMFGDATALAEGRLIALSPFMWHWRRGTLREDLLRFAPHLFPSQRPGCIGTQPELSQTK